MKSIQRQHNVWYSVSVRDEWDSSELAAKNQNLRA